MEGRDRVCVCALKEGKKIYEKIYKIKCGVYTKGQAHFLKGGEGGREGEREGGLPCVLP